MSLTIPSVGEYDPTNLEYRTISPALSWHAEHRDSYDQSHMGGGIMVGAGALSFTTGGMTNSVGGSTQYAGANYLPELVPHLRLGAFGGYVRYEGLGGVVDHLPMLLPLAMVEAGPVGVMTTYLPAEKIGFGKSDALVFQALIQVIRF
jgi:hypothetical protein